MAREVEAKVQYECPHCEVTSTVKIKAKVKPRLTLHSDMTETESYELRGVEVTPAGRPAIVEIAIAACRKGIPDAARACVEAMTPEERDEYFIAIKELEAIRSD